MYRVYSGPPGAEMGSALEKSKMLFKQVSSLDDALSWARHVNASGRVTLLIESDDGTCLSKQEVVGALAPRRNRGIRLQDAAPARKLGGFNRP